MRGDFFLKLFGLGCLGVVAYGAYSIYDFREFSRKKDEAERKATADLAAAEDAQFKARAAILHQQAEATMAAAAPTTGAIATAQANSIPVVERVRALIAELQALQGICGAPRVRDTTMECMATLHASFARLDQVIAAKENVLAVVEMPLADRVDDLEEAIMYGRSCCNCDASDATDCPKMAAVLRAVMAKLPRKKK